MKNKIIIWRPSYYWIVYITVLLVSLFNVLLYPNFIKRYLLVEPVFIYLVFIFLSIVHKLYKNKESFVIDKLFHKLNVIVLFVSLSLFLVSNIIESLTYSNFIFSKFHIHPKELVYPFFISLVEFIFNLNFEDTKSKVNKGIRIILNIKTLLLPFIILIFVNNILGIVQKMQKDAKFLLLNPLANKEEIMKYKVGSLFYDYKEFVVKNTDPNSKILLPPFPVYPWPQTGNAVYFRYFLYPRTLFSGNEFDSSVDLREMDYVLIAWGETPTTSKDVKHGWPKFNVPAEYMLFFQENGGTLKVEGDYKYEKYKDKELWGVIKVKKQK